MTSVLNASTHTSAESTRQAQGVETDALMESSFRRLLASLDNERDQIRGAWQRLQQERDGTTEELERLRQETESWCYSERQKLDAEWQRLDRLSDHMAKLWPAETEVLEINCSGHLFTVRRSTLSGLEDSVLSEMFSEEFISEIPRDEAGRFFLDFNPECFSLLIDYLRNRLLKPDAPLPIIPAAQQQNMEVMAEAWKLSPFLRENKVNPLHGTSLQVRMAAPERISESLGTAQRGEIIKATHPGWQVISAQHPLPLSSPSYFEVKVVSNPDSRGGLAIGVCGHIPLGSEIHSIRLRGSVLYNSNNGLIGDMIASDDVKKGIQLQAGESLGIRHDAERHCLQWFHNRKYIGTSRLRAERSQTFEAVFPIFALYVPDQVIQVNFKPPAPNFPESG